MEQQPPEGPRTIAIIQARRAASRLPDKVLLDIGGEPMLVRVVERARRAGTLSNVLVATTTDPGDDTDLSLPDADGLEVLGGLRNDFPAVPVVVLSASDRRDAVMRAIDLGAMGFIPKTSSNQVML